MGMKHINYFLQTRYEGFKLDEFTYASCILNASASELREEFGVKLGKCLCIEIWESKECLMIQSLLGALNLCSLSYYLNKISALFCIELCIVDRQLLGWHFDGEESGKEYLLQRFLLCSR